MIRNSRLYIRRRHNEYVKRERTIIFLLWSIVALMAAMVVSNYAPNLWADMGSASWQFLGKIGA